jgi:hypothetical protein
MGVEGREGFQDKTTKQRYLVEGEAGMWGGDGEREGRRNT